MKLLKPIISTFVLIAFLAVGVFGLMAMTGHHHEPGCPFMPGEQAICQMDVFDHISAWQNAFTAIVPLFIILLSFAAIALYIRHKERPPDIPIRPRIRPDSWHANIPSLYQRLFSRGILNPKIP